MTPERMIAMLLLLAVAGSGVAMAQAPSPAPDLEPGVQTSPAEGPTSPRTPSAAAPSAAAPGAVAPLAPTAKPPAQASAPAAGAPAASAGAPGAKDRVQLDTTQISGNRELPRVMYVVPWRRADLGEYAGRPPNSLLDEALTPVDRDVFRRQNRYYSALEAGAAAPGAAAPGAAQSGSGAANSQPDAAVPPKAGP